MPLSEQRKRSLYKYAKEKLKRIPLDVRKEKYEEIKLAADEVKETVNGYIKVAIDERMKRQKGIMGTESQGANTSNANNTIGNIAMSDTKKKATNEE